MSFFSRLRDVAKSAVIGRRQREATKRFEKGRERTARTTPAKSERVEIPAVIQEEFNVEPVIYEYDEIYETEPVVPSPRPNVPGPDPSKLSSGDLLSTAAFYGVSDEEYADIEKMIDIAYNDPASTQAERERAVEEIQDAMSMIHERAREEDQDFDWAAWREEVYGGKR